MDVTLAAETGRSSGTGTARQLRREGKVPGVVYGLGDDAVPVAVEWPALRAALTTDAGLNASGGTYLYLAFAEHPFGGEGVAQARAR